MFGQCVVQASKVCSGGGTLGVGNCRGAKANFTPHIEFLVDCALYIVICIQVVMLPGCVPYAIVRLICSTLEELKSEAQRL